MQLWNICYTALKTFFCQEIFSLSFILHLGLYKSKALKGLETIQIVPKKMVIRLSASISFEIVNLSEYAALE